MTLDPLPQVRNRVICGDAGSALRAVPDGCVQAIVTSPPYFQQRDYGSPGQIGNEPTIEQYVARLTQVFEECRRVLHPTGILWLNLGDKYLDGALVGAPWRVAFALQQTGWKLRADVIWKKSNAMPHSVKNRPTTDHEYVFMFTKSADYYYDCDAIREPHVTFSERSKMKGGRNHFGKRGGTPELGKNGGNGNLHDARWDQAFHPLGRNRRTVWEIPLGKYRGAHFAVFPEKLVETCVRASTRPGDIVLDPFAGSGTVGAVAAKHGRDYLLIEQEQKYCRLIRERVDAEASLFATRSSA